MASKVLLGADTQEERTKQAEKKTVAGTEGSTWGNQQLGFRISLRSNWTHSSQNREPGLPLPSPTLAFSLKPAIKSTHKNKCLINECHPSN